MLKKSAFYLLFLLLSFFEIVAQVNLQTGSAVFSLPVFSWQDNKSRLNSIVALSYNSGNGLKVNDVASNIGQGWSLVAGGVITRMQVGEPDDQVARNGTGTDDITKYPSGILYASTPAANGCPTALTKYPIYGWMNQIYTQHNEIAEDKQLDYFSFQFNGKAGMFVLDPTNIGVAQSLGDTKMKITFIQDAALQSMGIRTKITSFSIQDVDGLIYKFSQKGLTKVLRASYCDKSLTYKQTQPSFIPGGVYHMRGFEDPQIVNPWIVGSWHLTEIEDALTHRKILLNYVTRNIVSIAGQDISYNQGKNYSLISHKNSVSQTPEISSVVFPDGHTVSFNYGEARIDLAGTFILSAINVMYQGRYLSQHQFGTSYFILNRYGIPVTDYQKRMARLCLRSVRKIGVDLKEDSPPYLFDYYMGSNATDDFVPGSFFHAKDIWGYYNGSNSSGYNNETIPLDKQVIDLNNSQLRGLCYLRNGVSGVHLNAKNGYAKNGLLRQIIYPTGGTLTYEYEQNIGTPYGTGNAISVGGVHVEKTSSTDGGSSNGCNNPITTQYHYVMNGPGSASSLWGVEMPVNSMVTNSHYEPEYKVYRWKLSCAPFGCCEWKFRFPGILSQQQAINLTNFQNFMEAAGPVLGIISLVSTINDIATLIGATNPGFGTIAAVVLDIISGLFTVFFTCFADMSRDETATVFYNSDLNGIAPLPMQFKRVEVVENPGTIGKTIQEFTSESDYPLWVAAGQNTTFSAKQRFAPWAYGLPKMTTVFNSSGFKVKETENTYNFNTVYYIDPHCYFTGTPINPELLDRRLLLKRPINISSCKCLVKSTRSQRNTNWADVNIYNDPNSYQIGSDGNIGVDMYLMYTGRAELNKITERTFKPGTSSDFSESITTYKYNNENYEVRQVRSVKSDGEAIIKNIFYTVDYVKVYGMCLLSQTGTTNPEINTLVQNNIISLPVETNTIIGDDLPRKYLSDRATIFTTLANGDIKPASVIEARLSQPAYKSSLWNDDPIFMSQPLYNPVNPDYTFYKTVQTFSYDNIGNLTGVKDEGNRQVASIYDYDDKYVTATVVNADVAIDKCAYSSFETNTYGGWTLNGSFNTNSNFVTGVRSLTFGVSNSLIRSTLNTAKAYTLSFWASNSSVVVSGGATLVKSAPTINGFTYYEYSIAQGTGSVTLTGNCNLDELRLYPKASRMSTTTYDPLIGKTSECDGNNRITYYEYDNLGRLQFIKDDYRSIVKMYEYNNVSAAKQNGCPGTYYNRLISETFTRNNCGPGYLGGNITYTVPASMFSSSLSQADADAKAENYLLTYGQQQANTTGACIQLYYNTEQYQNFESECPDGYIRGMVTYTVPANRYYSTISVTDANQRALEEIAANGQAYANDPAYRNCTINYNPEWEADDGAPTQCQMVGGQMHRFMWATDVNPYSASYGQSSWQDLGPDATCPPANDVTVYGQNFTVYDQYAILTNTATSQQYFFYIQPSGATFILGDVPAGIYDIQIYDNSGGLYWMYSVDCGVFYMYSAGASFYNIPVDINCSTILVTP